MTCVCVCDVVWAGHTLPGNFASNSLRSVHQAVSLLEQLVLVEIERGEGKSIELRLVIREAQ